MKNDFYIDESEVAIACNTAFGLLNFLAATVASYSTIMNQVMEESIRDKDIDTELADIISKANSFNTELVNLADKLQKNIIAMELSSVEENNKFDFPTDPNLKGIPLFF